MAEKDTLRIEGMDLVIRAIDAPLGFRECGNPREKRETIKRNERAILQLFNIRVIVYPERVEIKGAIPTQILNKTNKEETAPIITSAIPLIREGEEKKRGFAPLRRLLPLSDC